MINYALFKSHPDIFLQEIEKQKHNYLLPGHTIAIFILLTSFISQIQLSI